VEGEGLGSGAPNVDERRQSPAPVGGGSARDLGRRALEVESNSVLVATIALIAFIGIVHPDFLSWGQLKEVVQNSVYVGIIAAGMAFLISMREIDLSIGSMFGLSLVGSALLMKHGMNPWVAGVVGVGFGCAMGLFNAVLVQFIAIPAIVATLATLSMYRGLSQALSDGQQVTGLPAQNSFFTSSVATSSASRSASGS
jgi:ribose transport system permease protein